MHQQDYNLLSDVELLVLLKESDHAAYTEIYGRYDHLLFDHAYKKLRQEEQAKDIVQDVFVTLWTKRECLPVINNLPAYLMTMVKNSIFGFFEHGKVETRYIKSLTDYVNTGNLAHTDYLTREREWNDYIESAIQALPKKMRTVFELSRKSNLTHKEIARNLSLSERTVNAQILNALLRLKTRLGSL